MTAEVDGKILVKDGVWQVAPDQRPKGWDTIYVGTKEPDNAPWSQSASVAVRQPAIGFRKTLVPRKTAAPANITINPDLSNVTVTASRPEQLPHMQEALLQWCETKLAAQKAEALDLDSAHQHAASHKWATGTLARAAKRAQNAVYYYEKLVDALRAGYCVFPTMDCDVFAVRTKRVNPDRAVAFGWNQVIRTDAQALPHGEGRYVAPEAISESFRIPVEQTRADGSKYMGEEVRTRAIALNENPEFPLILAKPHLMELTSNAMALKVFDEIGFLPAPWKASTGRAAHGDPIIVGRIIDPRKVRGYGGPHPRISFLIGWLVDTREL